MPSAEPETRNAPVIWAQRQDMVFLTVNVEDCKDAKVDVNDTTFTFKGHKPHENAIYHTEITFYGAVDGAKARRISSDRSIQYVIPKKDTSVSYWPRLMKDNFKPHWLKIDFSKWRDDDESDEEVGGGDMNFEEMMRNMGGTGGMEGMDDRPDLGDIGDDSDDDDMPDLEDDQQGDEVEPKEGPSGDGEAPKAKPEGDENGVPPATAEAM